MRARHLLPLAFVALGLGLLPAEDGVDPKTLAQALAHNDEGVKLAKQGDLEGALTELAQALALTPDEPTVKANAAKVHVFVAQKLVDARKFPEAARELHTAWSLVPNELEYEHEEGEALRQGGQERDAIAVFENVLRANPERKDTLVCLGQALYDLGRNEEAIDRWEHALKIDPKDADLAAALEKVKKEESVESSLDVDLGAPHFTIKFAGSADPNVGRMVGTVLEDAYKNVGYDLNRYPPGEVAVVVYPDSAFRDVTGTHEWVAAIYDGKIRVPAEGLEKADAHEVRRILTHEYTHALIRAVGGPDIPAWLHEGLAQLEEGRTSADARALLAGVALPALQDLTGTFLSDSDSARVRVRYAASFAFLDWLSQQNGRAKLADLLDALGRGDKLDAACSQVFGSSSTDLYEQWRSGYSH